MQQNYGPWAFIAGGSEGIGADYSSAQSLPLKEGCKLRSSRGLSRALQAHQHDVLLF